MFSTGEISHYAEWYQTSCQFTIYIYLSKIDSALFIVCLSHLTATEQACWVCTAWIENPFIRCSARWCWTYGPATLQKWTTLDVQLVCRTLFRSTVVYRKVFQRASFWNHGERCSCCLDACSSQNWSRMLIAKGSTTTTTGYTDGERIRKWHLHSALYNYFNARNRHDSVLITISDAVFGLEGIHHHSSLQSCDTPPPDCTAHSCT